MRVKRLFLLCALIAMVILASIVFISCDKDTDHENNNNKDIVIDIEPEVVSKYMSLEKFEAKGFEVEKSSHTLTITKYTGNGTDITIPDIVESNGEELTIVGIGDEAFKDNTSITQITFPNTLKTIGESAFENAHIFELTIPGSVSVISEGAFRYCSNLKSLTLQDGVAKIEAEAFMCCNFDNISWPDSLISIGDEAFSHCKLPAVELPANLVSIGKQVFYCARGDFFNSTVELPEGLLSIGDEAFVATSLKQIQIPNSVQYIGYGAFRDTELTSVVLPDNLTEIKEDTFYRCSHLRSVVLPSNLKYISSNAFQMCDLRTIVLPEGLEYIDGTYTLENKKLVEIVNLSSLDLSNYWNTGYAACHALDIYTSMDEYETHLTTTDDGMVIYEKGAVKALISYDGDATDVVVPNDITYISQYAFFGSNVKTVTIPTSVTRIKDSALRTLSINKVIYEGTKDQWDAIIKESYWKEDAALLVSCTDQDIQQA